jgi:S1-C subfamily serine protease
MESRGRLGITVQSLTPDLEEYFGATNGGALVSSVSQGSVAARAGLKAGDVITSINGQQVNDTGDLNRIVRELTGEITIAVLRDKKAVTLKGTLETRQ